MIVLNTRPEKQAVHLTRLIENNGGTVFHLPLIKIEPVSFTPINPEFFDYFIFTSANAVDHFFSRVDLEKKVQPTLIAVGPATKYALEKKGFTKVVCPKLFSSEGLLRIAELKNCADKKIAIICGENSKTLLQHELIQRRAEVAMVFCYRRIPINYDMHAIVASLAQSKIETIIVTSSESLSHLISLFNKPEHFAWLIQCKLCVVTHEMKTKALVLGFRSVSVARKPTDEEVVKCIRGIGGRDQCEGSA